MTNQWVMITIMTEKKFKYRKLQNIITDMTTLLTSVSFMPTEKPEFRMKSKRKVSPPNNLTIKSVFYTSRYLLIGNRG